MPSLEPPPLRKILIIRNDRMGDLLMTLPAIHAVRKGFPDALLTLLLSRELVPLLEDHPDIDRLLPWDPPAYGSGWAGTLSMAWTLRQEAFDAAVIFNPSRHSHAAAFLAGIPLRIGYRRKWGFLLNRSIPDTKALRTLHETEYNLELARLFGIPAAEPVIHLPVPPKEERATAEILASCGVSPEERPIAFHPWTGNFHKTAHRRWPLESFHQLAQLLQGAGPPILVIGAPEFAPLMASWPVERAGGIKNLVGKVPLKTLPALLKRCALLVSNDSGPAHVAVAVDTPTIVVAARSQAPVLNRWGPRGPRHRILLAPTPEEVADAVRARPAGTPSHPCGS